MGSTNKSKPEKLTSVSKSNFKEVCLNFFQSLKFTILNLRKSPSKSDITKKSIANISEEILVEQFIEAKEMRASEIMIPRADIVAVDVNIDLEQLKEKFISTGFIRLIVYKKDLDEIMGFIDIRNLFTYLNRQEKVQQQFSAESILSKTIYAARSTRCLSLLAKMREQNIRISVILDEYGGIEGIVSMERLIEKVFGTSSTRAEAEQQTQPAIQKVGKNSYILDARTSIQEVEEILEDADFLSEEEGEYETIGGFVLSYLDRIPAKGEKFTHPSGIEIEIAEATSRLIKRIKITSKLER